jgi:hypothetical protein
MRKLQGRISKSPIPDQKKVSPSRGAGGKFTRRRTCAADIKLTTRFSFPFRKSTSL